MEAPVAPVGQVEQVVAAEKIGDRLNALQNQWTGFTTKAQEDTKNKIAEHTKALKDEISQITGKVKGINLGGLFSKGAAPAAAAAAGGRRTRRRKSSRKGKGKRKSTKRSKRSRKSKTNNKKKSKRVRFSLRRR
jgi:hypothetical protein